MTAEQVDEVLGEALRVARYLIEQGVPVFAAPPAMKGGRWDPAGGSGSSGYRLPHEWEKTIPSLHWLGQGDTGRTWSGRHWRPGWGLGAVMGHTFDGLDVDPRNGGDASATAMRGAGLWPRTTGLQRTPSGGWHQLIAPLGLGKAVVADGVDLQAGRPDGTGRGFLWIAPTVRRSKVDGQVRAYAWEVEPDLDELEGDTSGEPLREHIEAGHHLGAKTSKPKREHQDTDDGRPRTFSMSQALAFVAPHMDRLRTAPSGRINVALNDAACIHSHFVDGKFWTYEQAAEWLMKALEPTAYDGKTWKAENTIHSGLNAGSWVAQLLPEPQQEQGVEGLIDPAAAGTTERSDGRPGSPERPGHECSNAAVQAEWLRSALGTGPLAGMFARGPDIVHTPREGEHGYIPLSDRDRDHDGPAQVQVVRKSTLASRVQYRFTCYKKMKDSDGTVYYLPAMFPMEAARVATDVPDELPNLRVLRGVVHTPVFRPDGTILAAPGYDPGTGLLHLPEPGLTVPPVPERPTGLDVKRAVVLLDEMVAGFNFLTDDDRANYYGLLLTPLLRTLVPPPYKLGAIGAPQPGSGKSLLAAVLRIVHGGVFRSEVPEDDAEMRKQITSILSVTTGPIVQFDNVSGVLRSSTLSGLLTSNRWDDRPLGVTDMVSRDNDRLWIITGNNLALGGDLVRRTLWVTIDPGVPDPHLRTGFKISDLEAWARDRRGELLHALLVMIRAWVSKDRPAVERQSDSYAGWVGAVAGILSGAEVKGTFDAPGSARQTVGVDDDDWADFLTAALARFGNTSWTVKELLEQVDTTGQRTTPSIPLDALPAELAERVARSYAGAGIVAKSLGMWLRNRDGRWAGGLTVRAAGASGHDKVKRWQVHSPEDKSQRDRAGSAGSAGTRSEPDAGLFGDDLTEARHVASQVPSSEAPKQTPQTPQTPQPAPTHDHDGRSPLSLAGRPCPACEPAEATG